MLRINSIPRGIVIDHIPAGLGNRLFKLLELDQADFPVALIMNAKSQRMGRKDLIKIENELDTDLSLLGIFSSSITINRIDQEKIIEKVNLSLPEQLDSFLSCNNPRCITQTEADIKQSFHLTDPDHRLYSCDYCDHIYNIKEDFHVNH